MLWTIPFLAGLLSPLMLETPAPEAAPAPAVKKPITLTNIRQVVIALVDFDSMYNAYPSADTAQTVKESTGTDIALKDTSSNQLFRQLIVTGMKSEKPFCLKPEGEAQLDDKYQDNEHILAPGECSFSYITGRSTADNPSMPILLAPMIKGTTTFDPKPFDGKAVIVRNDGTVEMLSIGGDGKVLGKDGKEVLDPKQEYWGGKKPEIRYPE